MSIITFLRKIFTDYEFWRGLIIGLIILILGNFVFVKPIKIELNNLDGKIQLMYVKDLVNNKKYQNVINLTAEDKIEKYSEPIKIELKNLRKVSEDAIAVTR